MYASWNTSTENELIFKHYILAQEALAADNFEQAKSAIKDLAEKSDGELKILSEAASTAKDLKSLREVFKPLFEFLAELELPDVFAKTLIIASGEGAKAAISAKKYLLDLEE